LLVGDDLCAGERLERAPRDRVQQRTQCAGRIGAALADLVDTVFALLGVGGVEVEELAVAAERADAVLDVFDVRECGAAVHVDAEDVHTGPGELDGGGFAEAAGRAEDEGPGLLAHACLAGGRVWGGPPGPRGSPGTRPAAGTEALRRYGRPARGPAA